MDESWVVAYQELLQLEKKKLDAVGLGEWTVPSSFLSTEEIETICLEQGVNTQSFLSSDLLVKYSDSKFRTMHFDLIYRLINIRNREPQRPIPLEYRIELQSEPVPDFGRYKFNEILPHLIPDNSVREMVFHAFSDSKYGGLSSHQMPIVKELLSEESRYRTAAIVAPTASGKTLTFFLPVVTKAVQRYIKGRKGVSSLLIYPRKALGRDQLQSFLRIIDSINSQGCKVTVGIDDGDTKRITEIRNNDTYRELQCVKCSNSLTIQKEGRTTKVRCSNCSYEYPYLLASKDEIWESKPTILITNIQTMYRRLLTPRVVGMFAKIDYVVFDEAHVYTDYLGGHVFHLIKLLRHAAQSNGTSPYFVFSSATIPNPTDFISKLAGVEADEIFYVDYLKTLEKIQGVGRRLMLYLYLLPHPDSSVETLTEALILATTLWCHRHNLKAITFIDSVAEISTLSDYLNTTIFDRRQGREVTDHLYNTHDNSENSYSWHQIAPQGNARDQDAFRHFVLSEYRNSIGIHYGQLPLGQRAKIESDFLQGRIRLLLATSTLELGINISDVAIVIQHKLPIREEGVVQRVGRSGRSPACLRVALGIIALQSSPLSTLYMFDERIRGRLADPNLLPPVRVGQASTNIRLQHTLSLLLYKRAMESRPTFIAGNEYLRSKDQVLRALRELAGELDSKLLGFNDKIKLFNDRDMLRNQIERLRSLFSAVLDTPVRADRESLSNTKLTWEETLVDMEGNTGVIRETLAEIEKLRDMIKKIQLLDMLLGELESLASLLRRGCRLCETLLRTARSSYRIGSVDPIHKWYKMNSDELEKIKNEIPDSDEILSRFIPILNNYISGSMKGDYKALRVKYGFGYDDVMNSLSWITKSIGSKTEKGLARFLSELPSKVKFLQSVDLTKLVAYEALERVEKELKVTNQWGINIFDAINLLLLNRTKFSLLLEPPSPELQLAGVEDA